MGSSERHDKRARILEAALSVFSRKGVLGTRIADIANEAGIAYGLVYHYFKNKEEILNTIFTERWAEITERLEVAERARGGTSTRLRSAAAVFIEAYRDRPQVVELLTIEFARVSDILEPVNLEKVARAFGVVRRIIEKGQDDGEIRRELNAGVLMLLLVGGLQHLLQSQALGVFRPPAEFDARGAEMVVDAFLHGVAVA